MSMKNLKALPVMVLLAISLMGFGLANPGGAGAWLAQGPLYQYPQDGGGTWEYGFWNIRVRSNYNTNVCHRSTVEYNGNQQRSVNTRAGYYSYASIGAYNAWYNNDEYYYWAGC